MCETRIFMHTFNLNSISQMKKKIFSALLMGVFTLASMSMFVSCKDYDDDINDLDAKQQEMLTQLKTLQETVANNQTSVASQIEAAQKTANDALTAAQQAGADVTDLKSYVDEAVAAAEEAGKAAADAAMKEAETANTNAGNAQAAAEAAAEAAKTAQTAADKAMEKALEALEAAQSGATSEAVDKALADAKSALDKCANLDERLGALEALAEGIPALIEQVENAATKDELNALKNVVDGYQEYFDSIFSMVTSVELYASQGLIQGTDLKFNRVIEQDNVFPEKKDEVAKGWFTFVEGDVKTYEAELVVRVSPTNATLNAEDITLINSQGVELSDYVTCSKVERYDNLLTKTRATTNNGLWKVSFKLKDDYVPADFEKVTTTENGTKQVLFAVAVKNTDLDNADRRVVSAYDVTVMATPAQYASNTFDLRDSEGIWENIEDVHNRYYWTEQGVSTMDVEELVWDDNAKPATKAITEGSKKNASDRGNRYFDYRQYAELLAAEVNKAIEIRIDWNETTDQPNHLIRGFYVTLDREFALESVPSEINAWDGYTYENVGKKGVPATLFVGNTGYITIKDLGNVAGDVIGFRLYAVNLDGTLVDPDGRAFYVAVGNAATTGNVTGNIIATKARNSESDFIDVEDGLFIDCDDWSRFAWEPSKDNKLVDHDGQTITGTDLAKTVFTVKYYNKDKEEISITNGEQFEDVKYVKFVMPNAANFVDGETYTQTLKLYNEVAGQKVLAKTITARMTKVMPEFPTAFAIKIGQATVAGGNTVRPYVHPSMGDGWKVGTKEEIGYTDLKDLFDGLLDTDATTYDEQYFFTFADSKANPKTDAADKYIDNEVVYSVNAFGTGHDGYKLAEIPSEIVNDEPHAVAVSYTYSGVSSYKKNDGTWAVGVDYDVDYDGELFAQYACWHHDMVTPVWDEKAKTTLAWSFNGTTHTNPGTDVVIGNTHNAEFGGTLASLLKANYLEVVTGSEKLTAENGSVSPYFNATVAADGTITFTQNMQNTQAPYSSHKETLTFKVRDSFKHEITISLEVTVENEANEE